MPPQILSDYYAHAAECERLAEKAISEETREIMAYLALRWRKLAEQEERKKTPLGKDRPLSPSS
jgi:hypothetical protein